MSFRIGWFTTARDIAARELFLAVYNGIKNGEIDSEISFVFSNREQNESAVTDDFFELIKGLDIPLVCFSSKKFKPESRLSGNTDKKALQEWRLRYDREIIGRIESFKPELIVLAGYMLIAGGEICRKFNMINLHPALPGGPIGTWQEVIWQLIEGRADITGAMMHLVTENLDEGPPITYYSFPIKGGQFDERWKDLGNKLRNKTLLQIAQTDGENNPLFALIREEGVRREIPLLYYTVRGFSNKKLKIENGKVVVDGNVMREGYCLNEEIEKSLRNG